MTGAKPACNRHCNAQAGQKDKQAGIFFDRNHLIIELYAKVILAPLTRGKGRLTIGARNAHLLPW